MRLIKFRKLKRISLKPVILPGVRIINYANVEAKAKPKPKLLNVLTFNNMFKLFPPLVFSKLTKKGKLKLLGCSLQLVSESQVSFFQNILKFYSGLKYYHSNNVKQDIHASSSLDKKLGLTYNYNNSQFINGNFIYPLANNYCFLKTRFILNLKTKKRLNKNQLFLVPFIKIFRSHNKKAVFNLIDLYRKYRSVNNKKHPNYYFLKFYIKKRGNYNSGWSFGTLGLKSIFLRKRVVFRRAKYKRGKISRYRTKLFNLKKIKHKLFYLIKNYKSRSEIFIDRFFRLVFRYFSFYDINSNFIVGYKTDTSKLNLFIKLLIKEFVSIKKFLRLYLIMMFKFTRKKLNCGVFSIKKFVLFFSV